jgi:hypothetical protein
LNGKSWRRYSNGYPHRLRPVTANTARRRQLPKFKMAAIKPEVEIALERCMSDGVAISTSTHIFSAMPDTM